MKEKILISLLMLMAGSFALMAQVPSITSFSPLSGPIGTEVTITGTNFDATPANNLVYFGGIRATVSSATTTELTVEVPVGASYKYLYVNTGGLIAQSSRPFTVTFDSDGSIGNSPSTFANVVDFETGAKPLGFDLGDLDGDGKLDMVAGSDEDEIYSIFLNTSTGPGDINFSKTDLSANAGVNDLQIVDLDGDGRLDFAAITEDGLGAEYLEVWRNTTISPGSASFVMDANILLDGYTYFMEVADFNGDGKIDVAVPDWENSVIAVYQNSSTAGSISFVDDVDFDVTLTSTDLSMGDVELAMADLNGDGLMDIVTTDEPAGGGTTKTASILENTSSGGSLSFATKVDMVVPGGVELGDLNGDGLPEMVIQHFNQLSIYKNESGGSIAFASPEESNNVANGYIGMTIEDFNGDSKADILIKDGIYGDMRVLENTGTGSGLSFSTPVDFDLGPAYTSYANYTTGDMDGDGEPDIVAPTNYYPDPSSEPYYISILRNKNSQTDITAFSFAEQVAPATIDADAHTIEIAVGAHLTSLTPSFDLSYNATATVSALAQTSGATANDFSSPVTYTITAEDGTTTQDWTVTVSSAIPTITSFSPASSEIGSQITITGTNFSTNPTSNIVYFGGVTATVLSASETELTVEVPVGASSDFLFVTVGGLIAQTDMRFVVTFDSDGRIGQSPSSFADKETFTAGDSPYGFDLGDVDGDGLNDMVTGNYGGDFSVYVNTSTGIGDINFATKADFTLSGYANDAKLADFDGDGKLDFAAAIEDDAFITYLEVKRNTTSTPGSVSFANGPNITLDGYGYVLEATDFNADGKIDIVVFDSDNGLVSVYENSSTIGSISFEDNVDFTIGSDPYDLTFGDINADGLPDIITLDGTDFSVSVLENTSVAGSISFATKVDFALDLVTSISTEWVEVGDLNVDGLPEILVKNNQSISIFENESSTSISMASPVEWDFFLGTSPIYLDDYNGDGLLDILTSALINEVMVLKNTSSGSMISFDSGTKFPTSSGYYPLTMISGDLDGDGEPDIAGSTFENISYTDYKVEVIRNHHSKANIVSFSFAEQLAPSTINTSAKTISINVDGVLDLMDLTASFELSYGAEAAIGSTVQTSGVTSNDFTNPVVYSILAEDSTTTQDWTVTVILGCSDDVVDLTEEACGSYDFDGDIIISSGIYIKEYTNTTGCDSTVTVDLTIHPVEFYDNVYAVGSYDFDGVTLTSSGQYEYGPFTSTVTGCDSTFFLNLIIEPDTYDPQSYLQFQPSESGFPIIEESGVSLIEDVDGDGEKDLFIIGKSTAGQVASLFINDADGTFTEKTDHGIGPAKVGNRSSLFMDVNEDDVLDYLVFGVTSGTGFTKLYLNDGSGNFTEKTDHNLPELGDNSLIAHIDSADVDGDNDLDLVISIHDDYNSYQSQLWLNNGDGSFVQSVVNDFPTVDESVANFADFDGDGDQDLLLRGFGLDNKIWLNDGTGVFTPKFDESLSKLSSNGMVIFDMDGDGDLDIYDSNAEGAFSNLYTPVYFNDGSGSFTYDLSSEMPRIDGLAGETGTLTQAADFDNDGDLDLIMEGRYRFAGAPSLADYVDVWINNGFGHFKPLLSHTFTKTYPGDPYEFGKVYGYGQYQYNKTLSVFDFDRDGRLDILMSGLEYYDLFDEVSRIFSNKEFLNDLVVEVCDSYEFDGTTLTTSGNYQGDYTDEYGTTYPVNLDLTILESTNSEETVEVCDSYEWNSVTYTESGTYQEFFTNAAGCDSTATLNLTILESNEVSESVSSCESYLFDGVELTTSGNYDATFTNASGCDSLVHLTLTILEPTSSEEAVSACESYDWNGVSYTTSGTYEEVFTNSVGCDSTATLVLTILEPTSSEETVSVCDSYDWNGTTYTTSGTYDEVFTNSLGCDSTATLVLTILEPTSSEEAVSACESYDWNGATYTASGTYEEVFTNSVGCDSTATLVLTILEPTSSEETVSACDSYDWNGVSYTTSGTYEEVFTNSAGCDSTATLVLTILESTSSEETISACDSYDWNGATYTTSGTYEEVFTNSVGCDSTAMLVLTILESTSSEETVSACESYDWNGATYTTSGTYEEVFTNSVGCDSTAMLVLTILESTSSEETVSACESYDWNGATYTTSGTYEEVFTNSVGCDSTATLVLTILESTSSEETVLACGSYDWNGVSYTTSGTYEEVFTNSVGCDSTATLVLTILESTSSEEIVSACGSYDWNGVSYTTSGTYEEVFTNSAGCDSTATLVLTILESTSSEETVSACESYDWNGVSYTTSGTYEEVFTSASGCDSTAILNLTILTSDHVEVDSAACGSMEFDGVELTVPGVYEAVFTNSLGCDSTVTLNLEILEEPIAIIEIGGVVLKAEMQKDATYQWIDCDTDTFIEGETKRLLTPPRNGNYAVAVSNGHCTVISECVYFDWILNTENSYQEIQVYPTSTTGLITVDLQEQYNDVVIEITSMSGLQVEHHEFSVFSQSTLELNSPAGMYIVQVLSAGELIKTQRIIKQ